MSGHNIANQNSDDFTPGRVDASEIRTGGVLGKIEKRPGEAAQGYRDHEVVSLARTNPIEESVTRTSAVAAYRAQLAALRAEDEAYRSLLDAVG